MVSRFSGQGIPTFADFFCIEKLLDQNIFHAGIIIEK